MYAPTISDRKLGTHIGPALKSTITLAITIASLTANYQRHMVHWYHTRLACGRPWVQSPACPLSRADRIQSGHALRAAQATTLEERCGRPGRTVWPSGLRRWLKAPVRKGAGSNPTAVTMPKRGRANFCILLGAATDAASFVLNRQQAQSAKEHQPDRKRKLAYGRAASPPRPWSYSGKYFRPSRGRPGFNCRPRSV